MAVIGFFTPASTADDRTEKINLGITTLLAMSILMVRFFFDRAICIIFALAISEKIFWHILQLMISDQMPSTSDFVPLIAWFYLSVIIIISIGTFLTS